MSKVDFCGNIICLNLKQQKHFYRLTPIFFCSGRLAKNVHTVKYNLVVEKKKKKKSRHILDRQTLTFQIDNDFFPHKTPFGGLCFACVSFSSDCLLLTHIPLWGAEVERHYFVLPLRSSILLPASLVSLRHINCVSDHLPTELATPDFTVIVAQFFFSLTPCVSFCHFLVLKTLLWSLTPSTH